MTKTPALIMEYVDTGDVDFRTLYKSFTDYDIRFYIYEEPKVVIFWVIRRNGVLLKQENYAKSIAPN